MKATRRFMKLAIEEAKEIGKLGGYPIGAVIVRKDEVIAKGSSKAKVNSDITCHAEIDAIRNATSKLGSMYLENCILYTTLEPCAMCAAASVWAKLKCIVYGASMEDAINFAKSAKDKNILSYRQIKIKCKYVLSKAENKVELIENFERESCKKLFELSK